LTLALALASTVGFGWWLASDDIPNEAASTERLVNQVWIERMPEDPRDMIHHVVMLDGSHGKIGAAGVSSRWRHRIEAFRWALEGDRLLAAFPQDRVRASFQVRTWRCAGEAPRPFELCLEIRHEKRSARFYSRDDWDVRVEALTQPNAHGDVSAALDAALTNVREQTGVVAWPDLEPWLEPGEASDAWPSADDVPMFLDEP